jgi:L-ribulokinase
MGRLGEESYVPDPASREIYDALYGEYLALHDLFGRGGSNVMRTLKRIRLSALAGDD